MLLTNLIHFIWLYIGAVVFVSALYGFSSFHFSHFHLLFLIIFFVLFFPILFDNFFLLLVNFRYSLIFLNFGFLLAKRTEVMKVALEALKISEAGVQLRQLDFNVVQLSLRQLSIWQNLNFLLVTLHLGNLTEQYISLDLVFLITQSRFSNNVSRLHLLLNAIR